MKNLMSEKIFEVIYDAMASQNCADTGQFAATKAAEKIMEIVATDSQKRLERIEMYLEAGFLASNFQHTESTGALAAAQLKQKPGDIKMMGLLARLDNDQKIIEPRMRDVVCGLWQYIVAHHGNGGTLKYFEMVPPKINNTPTSNLHIS
jgi:hypothetical protein